MAHKFKPVEIEEHSISDELSESAEAIGVDRA
jgi:hypothetical protein